MTSKRPSNTTRKPITLVGINPANDIESYNDVPWFRKQEVALFPLFLPITIFTGLTGDVFHKANPKMKDYSNAEVWRYSAASRAFFIAVSLAVLVTYYFIFFG